MRSARFFLGAAFVLIFMLGCDAGRGIEVMGESAVDWKSLEFKCVHEDDSLVKMDDETEEWYQQGNAAFKAGVKLGSEELLRTSFEKLMLAAERGHIKAMNNVVLAYLNGDGVKRSDSKAVEWAEKMVAKKSGRGHYHMGTFLQQGIGVKQDQAAALAYFRRAADLGNSQGQMISAEKLISLVAQTADREQGFKIGAAMLTCALNQGLAEAGYKLGRLFSQTNTPSALGYFQSAATLGHQQSLFKLRLIFQDGEYGVAKDDARAACYQRLLDEADEDKTKKFPDLDKICPLPPKPMPKQ